MKHGECFVKELLKRGRYSFTLEEAAEELLATKLRALYQRRKGRDLFDLAVALRDLPLHRGELVEIFQQYMMAEGQRITFSQFNQNLTAKLLHPGFAQDCLPLLRPGTTFDLQADAHLVGKELLSQLPGPRFDPQRSV